MDTFQLKTARSLIPPVYHTLASVPADELSHNYYGARHPGGIFAIHFSEVITALNSMVTLVNNLQAQGAQLSDPDTEALKTSIRDFLLHLLNYFESGYETLLCFCEPRTRPKAGEPLYKWFAHEGYAGEVAQYFTVVNPGLSRYRQFFNALKHSSNRVGILQFVKPDRTRQILGFYLEGVNDDGAIGPVVTLHPMFQGMHTAWSFNLHIRFLYFLVYKIAHELEAAVQRLCRRRSIPIRSTPPQLLVTGTEAAALTAYATAQRFETAFGLFYPQEADEMVVRVALDINDGSLHFEAAPAGDRVIPVRQGWILLMASRGDGFSRSWSLPYFDASKTSLK